MLELNQGVTHPEWLANPVLVKKKSGNWRMCVDYTILNKTCPKVPFPLRDANSYPFLMLIPVITKSR